MIHHVARQIPPPALEDCVDFYGLLGFQRVLEPPGIAGRAVWLQAAGTQIHLMPVEGAAVGGGHLAVVVDDYAGTVSSLRQAGHDVTPRREHWDSPRAYVDDPAGNTVELMAWPPGDEGR
jgi:catechol 2,3-dioxygenase-like lactoylglutathione lyase family enzyme